MILFAGHLSWSIIIGQSNWNKYYILCVTRGKIQYNVSGLFAGHLQMQRRKEN